VLAVESEKTASLLASLRTAHESSPPTQTLSSLDRIGAGTICSSLGARTVSQTCLDNCLAHTGGVTEAVIPEWKAVEVIRRFLDDHHMLVEPACAVALAPFCPSPPKGLSPQDDRRYRRRLIDKAVPSLRDKERPNVVVVVCGGASADMESLTAWEERFTTRDVPFRVFSDGQERDVDWS
jgi:L-serine/L-threonine ammonia-lyase